MQRIRDAVAGVQFGNPVVFRNLTVYPLIGDASIPADYLTLDEAMEQKCSSITEVSQSGSVPELKFINSGNRWIFLLDGEELIGAKQNRILNLSILVAAGKTLVVPVSCVEAGRWQHRSRQFHAAPRTQYAEGRARKMAQVSESMRATGGRQSNQSAVWNDIREKSARFVVDSETSAMSDIFEKEAVHLEDYVISFPVLDGQSGAVFAIDDRVVGMELFDAPETFRKLFPKLLRSYGLDALDRARSNPSGKQRCSVEQAMNFLRQVAAAKAEEFPAVGEGIDLRLSSLNLTGAALAANHHIIHLSAFIAQ